MDISKMIQEHATGDLTVSIPQNSCASVLIDRTQPLPYGEPRCCVITWGMYVMEVADGPGTCCFKPMRHIGWPDSGR